LKPPPESTVLYQLQRVDAHTGKTGMVTSNYKHSNSPSQDDSQLGVTLPLQNKKIHTLFFKYDYFPCVFFHSAIKVVKSRNIIFHLDNLKNNLLRKGLIISNA
jgi:hypothetical protein